MTCFKCGEEGHKSADCPGVGAIGGEDTKLACYTCGEVRAARSQLCSVPSHG